MYCECFKCEKEIKGESSLLARELTEKVVHQSPEAIWRCYLKVVKNTAGIYWHSRTVAREKNFNSCTTFMKIFPYNIRHNMAV